MTDAQTLSNPHVVRGHADSSDGLIVHRARVRRCRRNKEVIRALEAVIRAELAGTEIKVIAVGPDHAGCHALRRAVRAEIQKIRKGLP